MAVRAFARDEAATFEQPKRPRRGPPRTGGVRKRIAKQIPGDDARVTRWAAIAFGLFLALIGAVVLVALDVPHRAMVSVG